MKKIICFSLIGILAFLSSCSEDDIVPAVNTTPEYAELLKANAAKSDADAKIYEWYQKYGTAFLYDFRDADFSWQWAGKFRNAYIKFDAANEEDMAAVANLLSIIEKNFLSLYDEEFLKELREIDLKLTKVPFKNILVQFASDNGYKIIFGKKTIENKGNRINVGTFTITPII